ncbi:uncharacterized protein [Physcomitrium patens]|uniref:uncharacterized protein n=1 Tax=Physcomitrium patens TaxID=3218 RepID=UPI00024AEF63|nr:uncharacterized protein LOC112276315 [Physcomitrium patens]|eukprot:XP_024363270.1 uncharacterized protein LOC112276315 [Physcomitrella patens]
MTGVMSVAGFKELVAKYGKVALGVHMTVSAVSVTCCYTAIKNNVDVGAVLQRFGLYTSSMVKEEADDIHKYEAGTPGGASEELKPVIPEDDRKSHIHSAVSGGGALALAFLCNKALMPVRIPITVALTPPVARMLARRKLFKSP